MHMQKSLTATLLVLVIGLVLSACTGPQPATQVNFNQNSPEGSLENGTPANENTGGQNSGAVRGSMQVQGEPGMKTLADFAPIEGTQVTLTTNKGPIVIELFRAEAPITTLNFLTLVKDGFYDGIVFHRVIPGFMAQVGDPLTKEPGKEGLWGTGGAGYTIPDEFAPGLTHDSEGILSMANSGPNTGSSQIFITYDATPWLDGKHAVFGRVTSGMDVAQQLTNGDKIISATYQ